MRGPTGLILVALGARFSSAQLTTPPNVRVVAHTCADENIDGETVDAISYAPDGGEAVRLNNLGDKLSRNRYYAYSVTAAQSTFTLSISGSNGWCFDELNYNGLFVPLCYGNQWLDNPCEAGDGSDRYTTSGGNCASSLTFDVDFATLAVTQRGCNPGFTPNAKADLQCSAGTKAAGRQFHCLWEVSQVGLRVQTLSEKTLAECAQACCDKDSCAGFDYEEKCWLTASQRIYRYTEYWNTGRAGAEGRWSCELQPLGGVNTIDDHAIGSGRNAIALSGNRLPVRPGPE